MISIGEQFYLFKHKVLYKENALPRYNEALSNEKLDRDSILKLNFEKRKAIVTYAYENCPFYTELYDTNSFHPTMLTEDKDWSKVPIIEKSDIRNNYDKIISKTVDSKYFLHKTTGGSTGKPLKVLNDARANYSSILWRAMKWYNISFATSKAVVGRNVIPKSKFRKILSWLFHFPSKGIALDASSVSDKDIDAFIDKIRKTKPDVISGYVGTILRVARYIVKNNLQGSTYINLIHVTSAPVSNTERSIITKAFGGEIMDQYGSVEVTCLGFESPEHIGLYVPDDYRHVDIVDDNNIEVDNDVYGNIVVTDLENKVFPLIRYKNADRTKKLSIKGKLPFTLLAPIKGRVSDYIITKTGVTVSGEYLTTIFDDYPDEISAFQVVQHKDYSLTIKYVAAENFSTEQIATVISKVESIMLKATKNEMQISFDKVDEITDDRGKTRFVINELIGNLQLPDGSLF